MIHNTATYKLLKIASEVEDYKTKRRLATAAAILRKAEIDEDTADKGQLVLDAVGVVPGFGEIADGINVIVSLLRGDFFGAAMSLISMIPEAGDVVGKGGKILRWLMKVAAKPGKLGKLAKFVIEHGKPLKTALRGFVSFVEANSETIMQYLKGFMGIASGKVDPNAPGPIKALASNAKARSMAQKAGPGIAKTVGEAMSLVKSSGSALKLLDGVTQRAGQELKATQMAPRAVPQAA